MKYIKLCLFLTFLLFQAAQLLSCPTCIGRIEKNSPPFFSNEQYQPGHYQSFDDDDNDDHEEFELEGPVFAKASTCVKTSVDRSPGRQDDYE